MTAGLRNDSDRPPLPAILPAVLSFMAPGVGHLLLRMWSRAAIWIVGWFVVGGMTQGDHSLPLFLLMFVAGLDAYFLARAREDDGQAQQPSIRSP